MRSSPHIVHASSVKKIKDPFRVPVAAGASTGYDGSPFDATHAPLGQERPREYQKTPQDENTLLLVLVMSHSVRHPRMSN